jgi:hypothetical protein
MQHFSGKSMKRKVAENPDLEKPHRGKPHLLDRPPAGFEKREICW